jgi:heme/copper-type cytochrome/quinol oxidase subunit 4
MKKLDNKGSVWAWFVIMILMVLLTIVWVSFDYIFNNLAGDMFKTTVDAYPTQWQLFKYIFNGFLIALVGGCIWWVVGTSQTPRSGYQ